MRIYLLKWNGPNDINDSTGEPCTHAYAGSSYQKVRARYREILKASLTNSQIDIEDEADAIQLLTPTKQSDFIEIINNLDKV